MVPVQRVESKLSLVEGERLEHNPSQIFVAFWARNRILSGKVKKKIAVRESFLPEIALISRKANLQPDLQRRDFSRFRDNGNPPASAGILISRQVWGQAD
jgi:hypothetical protein